MEVEESINTRDIKEIKNEINQNVDDSISSIIKNMKTIFESIKFNENQDLEETNILSTLSSTEIISNKINVLFNNVISMKADFLKRNDFHQEYEKDYKNSDKIIKNLNLKINFLQDKSKTISLFLKEIKAKKNYIYSQSFNQ